MKIRVKYTKEGPIRFVGHLDTMRYFQKAIRRAALPAAFSGGFSPHMIMSFASPLGVGIESTGEYFDLELKETMPTAQICEALNSVMTDGVRILSVRQVEDGKAGSAMSLVAAADYYVSFREGKEPPVKWQDKIDPFLSQKEIIITKETKTGEKQVNIRPFIYLFEEREGGLFMRLASASSNFTRPETTATAFFRFLGYEPLPFTFFIRRLEIYASKETEEDPVFVSLESLGEEGKGTP